MFRDVLRFGKKREVVWLRFKRPSNFPKYEEKELEMQRVENHP